MLSICNAASSEVTTVDAVNAVQSKPSNHWQLVVRLLTFCVGGVTFLVMFVLILASWLNPLTEFRQLALKSTRISIDGAASSS